MSRKAILEENYKKMAKDILKKRLDYYCEIMGVEYTALSVRNQKTRWGSCSSKRSISLNYKLIFAPMSVMDYVIVHELCHLLEMNHSKAFWNQVERVLPDYKVAKKWLRENGHTFYLPFLE